MNLETHPKTSKIYISALDKLNQASYQRNLLDDLRLSMEVILKDILKMKKSLEKQKDEPRKVLKGIKMFQREVINMFVTLQDYFVKYPK